MRDLETEYEGRRKRPTKRQTGRITADKRQVGIFTPDLSSVPEEETTVVQPCETTIQTTSETVQPVFQQEPSVTIRRVATEDDVKVDDILLLNLDVDADDSTDNIPFNRPLIAKVREIDGDTISISFCYGKDNIRQWFIPDKGKLAQSNNFCQPNFWVKKGALFRSG